MTEWKDYLDNIVSCSQCGNSNWSSAGTVCLVCGYVKPLPYKHPYRKDKAYCAECLKFGRINEIPYKLHKGGMGEEK